jgi:hypothetical protein
LPCQVALSAQWIDDTDDASSAALAQERELLGALDDGRSTRARKKYDAAKKRVSAKGAKRAGERRRRRQPEDAAATAVLERRAKLKEREAKRLDREKERQDRAAKAAKKADKVCIVRFNHDRF